MSEFKGRKDKPGGNVSTNNKYADQPVTVPLDDGTVLDATHHIVNDGAQLLHLYLGDRREGIDVSVPLADAACGAWARSDRGREALDIERGEDAHGDDSATVASEDCEIMTDGGADR